MGETTPSRGVGTNKVNVWVWGLKGIFIMNNIIIVLLNRTDRTRRRNGLVHLYWNNVAVECEIIVIISPPSL